MGNDDFLDLLNYLKQCNCITEKELPGLKDNVVRDTGLNLFTLVVLFTGVDWAHDFILSLPLDIPKAADSTSNSEPDLNVLIATDFVCSRESSLKGWNAIESISFKVSAPRQTVSLWTFPLDTPSTSQFSSPYRLTHDRAIDIRIKWPAYPQRVVEGSYRGIFHAGNDDYHVVGELSMSDTIAPQYNMKFSDQEYRVKDYKSPISVVLLLFNTRNFPFSEFIQRFSIPGLDDALKNLGEALPLNEVGFILERTLSKIFLKEISGTLPLTSSQKSDWWPFKKTFFSVENLHVILRDLDSRNFRKVIMQLNGNITDFNPAVPFRLSAGLSERDTVFELAVLPGDSGGLSIQKILDITDISSVLDVSKTFPSVSNISNAFQISNATVGWGKKGISYLRLGIDIDEWNIISGKFAIANISLDMYTTSPAQSKRFSLSGSGVIQIGGVDLEIFLRIESGRVAFQPVILETLSLKTIFEQFLQESETLVPQGLVSILQETGIENVIVEGFHEGSGWSLSRFSIATDITAQLSISDKFSLISPRLEIDISSPFVKAKRKIDAAIGATIVLGETPCDISISWVGASSSLTVAFEPRGEPLLLATLLSLFIPGKLIAVLCYGPKSLSIPDSFTFLLGIGLANATLAMSWQNGGFKVSEMSATIVSSTSLELWRGLKLENLALHFAYSTLPGKANKSILFTARLSFSRANLDFTISYDGPTMSGSSAFEEYDTPDDTVAATTNKGEAWSAEVSYAGTISIIDIMSTVSGIDIRGELSSVGLSELRQLIDISLSDLRLVLTRKPDETSFAFNANLRYLFFDGPVHLTCSKSTSWTYSFTFGLSSEDFLSGLGIHGISLIKSSIALSNGPVMDSALVNTTSGGLNVSFSGTLVFEGSLRNLGKATGFESLIITGSVSSNSFTLAAATSQITIFNDMLLSGRLLFTCSTGLLLLAVEGLISNIKFPEISSKTFSTTFSLFVKLPNPELGFQFTLDRLDDAFGIRGLQFRSILFRAAFQEFPIPSEVAFTGKLWFHIGDQQFYGSVAIYFSENDLTHSATMGRFETFPSVNQSLEGFDDSGRKAPDVVNGTFADLEFSRALQAVRVGDITIPQGFLLKGSLKLPSIGFDAFFEISITPTRLHIAGDIKNAITVTVDNTRLFALTRAADSNRGPSLDLSIITSSPPTCNFSGEIYLLGLSAAAQFELSDSGMSFHETISVWLSGVKVDFTIDKKFLDLSASCALKVSMPSFKVGVVTISHIDVVNFSAALATKVRWEQVTWELTISGAMMLGGWDMGTAGPFTLNAELDNFPKIAQRLGELIASFFGDLFKNEIAKRLKEGLDQIVRELKALGVIAEETTELLVKEFDFAIEEVIKAVKEVFDLSMEKVAEILKDIGKTAEEVGRVLKDVFNVTSKEVAAILQQVGYAVEDVGRVLKDVYGVASEQVVSILKQAGYAVDDVGRVLKDVYGLASDQVASILQKAGYAVDDVGRVLKDVYGLASEQAASILKQAGYAVDDVGRALKDVYGLAEGEVASVLKQLGYSVNDVGRVLKDVYGVASDKAATIFKQIGYAVSDVGRTLKEVYDVASDQVASILKKVGYAVDDVGRVLKDVYNTASDQVDSILKNAGYAVDDVGRALKDVYEVTSDQAASILKQVGYAVDDVGRVLKDVYAVASEQAASILKQTGYAVDDVAGALKDVFDVTGQSASEILVGVGYAANDVNKALGDVANTVGGAIGDAADTVGGAIGDAANTVGGAIGDAASGLGKTIGGLFG